jgi:hypothetical protein
MMNSNQPRPAARWLAAAVLGAAVMLSPGVSQASGRLLDVQVFDRAQGRELPVIRHGGQLYVVGTPGSEYSVVLRNRTGADVLAVLSVDGVNAVSGETAAPEQTGYVLSAQQRAEIRGWRRSLQQTAAFFFTELPNSYAARTGRPDNVGVIGLAVFRRQAELPPVTVAPRAPRPQAANDASWGERSRAEQAAAAGASASAGAADAERAAPVPPAAAAARGSSSAEAIGNSTDGLTAREAQRRRDAGPLGTGHGRREHSPTQYTSFERATVSPEETITIFYDSRANLIARGILPAPLPSVARAPQAFPGFVADPPAR